jgi:hypothetical protein
MITTLILIALAFGGGFYAGVKNANSRKLAKAKDILDAIKK